MLYMYTTTIILKNNLTMNIVGISATKEVGEAISRKIMATYRGYNMNEFVHILKRAEVNVYLNEVPYQMADISELREEVFRKELDKYINASYVKDNFIVGASSVLPIQLSNATV